MGGKLGVIGVFVLVIMCSGVHYKIVFVTRKVAEYRR